MDRRDFLLASATALALRRAPAVLAAAGDGAGALALVTADTEAHVVAVDLATGVVRARIPVRPGPRSIERVGDAAIVAHTVEGVVTVLDGRTLAVRHVVAGFEEPRYTASARDGRHAFVTDSGRTDLAAVDVLRGVVVARLRLSEWPRHVSLSPDRRTLWVGLGTASPTIAVVDVSTPAQPRLRGHVRPGFPVHDVGFDPAGAGVWVTSGSESTIGVQRGGELRTLAADAAPQHVTFLRGRAFVTSGADGTVRVYDAERAKLLHTTRIPVGSYNVQFAAGRVLTPSLNAGTLCVLDANGRLLERVRVAASSHDACLARG